MSRQPGTHSESTVAERGPKASALWAHTRYENREHPSPWLKIFDHAGEDTVGDYIRNTPPDKSMTRGLCSQQSIHGGSWRQKL